MTTLHHAFALLLDETQRRVDAGVRSVDTLEMHQAHVRYLLERIPASTPLRALTQRKIAAVLEAEAEGRRERADGSIRRLSGGTVRKRASTLRRALLLSSWRGWLRRVPRFPEIPYAYEPRTEHLAAWEDYEQLRDALEPHRRLWFVVAVWTGQRRRDIEGMCREDLELDGRAPWVRVRSSKTRRRQGVKVHAPPELVAELRDHWRDLPAGAKLVQAWPHVSSGLSRLSARLRLPRTTAHRLRHTFFTWYVAANGFTAELLELGGWKDLTMPARIYAHAAPARFRAQIERASRLARRLRRGPQKISRKREPEPTAAGALPTVVGEQVLPAPAPPEPAHADHACRGQDGDAAARPSTRILPRSRALLPVGAE